MSTASQSVPQCEKQCAGAFVEEVRTAVCGAAPEIQSQTMGSAIALSNMSAAGPACKGRLVTRR